MYDYAGNAMSDCKSFFFCYNEADFNTKCNTIVTVYFSFLIFS